MRGNVSRLGNLFGELFAKLVVAYGNETHRIFPDQIRIVADPADDIALADGIIEKPDLLKNSELIRYFIYGMTVASRSEDQQIHLPCLGNCALGRPVHSVEQRRIGF